MGRKTRFLVTFWEEGPDRKEEAVCRTRSSGVCPPPTPGAMSPSAGGCHCHVQDCVVEYSAVVLLWKVIPLASHLRMWLNWIRIQFPISYKIKPDFYYFLWNFLLIPEAQGYCNNDQDLLILRTENTDSCGKAESCGRESASLVCHLTTWPSVDF